MIPPKEKPNMEKETFMIYIKELDLKIPVYEK